MQNLTDRYLKNLENLRIAGIKVERYMKIFGKQTQIISREQAQENYKKACQRWVSPLTEEHIAIHEAFKNQ
jgi:hypothetical protein